MTTPPKTRHDIWKVADQIQMDLRAAQAKMVELRAMLASLDLPDAAKITCPKCELRFRGPRTLAEHLHVSHNGPVPAHYLDIEQRSADPADPDDEPDLAPRA